MRHDDPKTTKVKVIFPNTTLILDAEKMDALHKIMSDAEGFDSIYHSTTSSYTYKIFPLPINVSLLTVIQLTSHQYNMAKLANDKVEE